MRFWLDTEFIEDGKTIDLISIGVVAEDGRTYYAECAEADLSRACEWVQKNVVCHLTGDTKPRTQIAQELIEFIGEKPEIWAFYGAYDWIAICQIYGRMLDLPKGWPKYCLDVKQWAVSLGNPELPSDPWNAHNALADAIWTRDAWAYLRVLQYTRRMHGMHHLISQVG